MFNNFYQDTGKLYGVNRMGNFAVTVYVLRLE
jgi:hypothetical protein